MKNEEVEFLMQLVSSLEKAEMRLEEAYRRGDYMDFEKIKSFILQIQRKILEAVRYG